MLVNFKEDALIKGAGLIATSSVMNSMLSILLVLLLLQEMQI